MAQVTGRIFISLNGKRIRSKDGASLDTGGVTRDAALSDAGVDGFTEAVAAPSVTCEVNHTADISVDDFKNFKDGTLTFETDTGKVFTLTNAWCSKPPKLAKGVIPLEFMGTECLEG